MVEADRMAFSPSFLWGVSTSAYQIEGAADEDGKGPSIWDWFVRQPGTIVDGSTGDVACDHYHRYREDVALLSGLGVDAYRFSISWPRVLPEGTGRVNSVGMAFYDRLVDELLGKGIEPVVTLYHWDLPLALHEAGGWPARRLAGDFADYAGVVAEVLGDRVTRWITINEPWVVAVRGYALGDKAPGDHDGRRAMAAAHHLLLGHGLATEAVRARCPDAEIGITLNLTPVVPASRDPLDQEAARRLDGQLNRWYLDPLYGHGYPADVIDDYAAQGWLDGAERPRFVVDGDLDVIATPSDFLGVNYYERTIARDPASTTPAEITIGPGSEVTEMGWEVYPEGLVMLLDRIDREYRPASILITENGAAFPDEPDEAGAVHDERRIAYLHEHVAAAATCVRRGIPLRGYFVWSLLDNFEWAFGYTRRFGLVWVDFESQRRVPKDSYAWYRDWIREGITR